MSRGEPEVRQAKTIAAVAIRVLLTFAGICLVSLIVWLMGLFLGGNSIGALLIVAQASAVAALLLSIVCVYFIRRATRGA